MKKYTVVQYWPKGTTISIKFQGDDLVTATAVLTAFNMENPGNHYCIVKTI